MVSIPFCIASVIPVATRGNSLLCYRGNDSMTTDIDSRRQVMSTTENGTWAPTSTSSGTPTR